MGGGHPRPFPLAHGQLKFLIVGVDYFKKWIETKVVAKIIVEKVHHFYWEKIICGFGLPDVIISDSRTQFKITIVTDFFRELGVQKKFVSVVHLLANRQEESANKVILRGLKKKLDDTKGLWA